MKDSPSIQSPFADSFSISAVVADLAKKQVLHNRFKSLLMITSGFEGPFV